MSGVLDGIWPNFQLIQAFMNVIVICKMKMIQSKMKALERP